MFSIFYSMMSIPLSLLFLASYSLIFCKGESHREKKTKVKNEKDAGDAEEDKKGGEDLAQKWGLNDQPPDEEIKTDLDDIREDNPLARMKPNKHGKPDDSKGGKADEKKDEKKTASKHTKKSAGLNNPERIPMATEKHRDNSKYLA
ncbi:unnamed protein product, partial [Mesorhabditis spiculigera]